MAKCIYHGDGIVSKLHRARDRNGELRERRFFYVRYQHEGRRFTQQAGGTEKQARALLARIDRERREARHLGVEWIPPKVKVAQDRLAAEIEQRESEKRDERATELVGEATRKRFEERHGESYAKPKDIEQILNHLGRALAGRRLDEVTRADVQTLIDDRLAARGVFKGLRANAVRAAQREALFLCRVFNFLRDEEGREMANPAERAWARRQTTKKTRYHARKPVIPTDEQRTALFGALVTLTYYTAARPESESCRILHGDVVLPDRGKVRTLRGGPELGTVTYGSPKVGEPRTVPLHPEAEQALRAAMVDEPEGEAERAAWRRLPVFARKSDGEPWRQSSYRHHWRAARAHLMEGPDGARWPELADMRLRDLRNAAITDMRRAGTERTLAAKLAGHNEGMSDHYTTLTTEAAREAILRLGQGNMSASQVAV